MQKLKRVAAPVLLCVCASCAQASPAVVASEQAAEPAAATAPFAAPEGPFAVGTHEYLWVDPNRGEPFTKDPNDKRHLLARIWYPAEKTGAAPAHYVLDANEFPHGSVFRQAASVKTNAVTDAPIARGTERFPVLVYQPGAGMARFVGTFVAEQLASHGYVVLAADHPSPALYGAPPGAELFPDGYRFKADTLTPPQLGDDLRQFAFAQWDWLDEQLLPEWQRDAVYTLDKIEELERSAGQMFHQRLDTSRIGIVGWSFGGSLSVQMSRDDPRVKAAVYQDGMLFGDVRDKGTTRPFMLMLNNTPPPPPKPDDPDQQALQRELLATIQGWHEALMQKSTGDGYTLTIAGTDHLNFSDLPLLLPANPKLIEPRRAHQIITAYTLAFFDKYLRGKESELLKGPSSAYPEVTFVKKE
ncbi:MAG: alpha/beta hydrolase family protein [Steroidobacteraceae bacterium]